MQSMFHIITFLAVVHRSQLSTWAAPLEQGDGLGLDVTNVDLATPFAGSTNSDATDPSLRDTVKELNDQEDDVADHLDDFGIVAVRAKGSPNNPIDAYIDCTGIEEMCDKNCYAILCLGKDQTLSKGNSSLAAKHRQQAGAKSQPFKGTDRQLSMKGLSRPDKLHVSAEEYPYASTNQGGDGAALSPATAHMQSVQGKAIDTMYSNYGIEQDMYFNLNFRNADTPYCNALRRKDYSVCNDDDLSEPWGYDNGKYMFERDYLNNQKRHYSFVGKQ